MPKLANPSKASVPTNIFFPAEATMINGSAVTPTSGGVVIANGHYYSLSTPALVAGGTDFAQRGIIISQRVGRITLTQSRHPLPTTMGGEVEWAIVDKDSGYYSDKFEPYTEALTTMAEDNTEPVPEALALEEQYRDLAQRNIQRAARKGVLLVPVSVFGQRGATANELVKTPYMQQTLADMEQITGFSAEEALRICGVQFHTRISNHTAALQAAEAMQLLNPILVAPSLTGPFLEGRLADKLLTLSQFTDKQLTHLERTGLKSNPFSHEQRINYQSASWRYVLRRIASPWAGIWSEPAPDSLHDYLQDGHHKLATGQTNTIDRFRGPHADRIRSVLNGSGATTFESCAYDTFAGNPRVITDHHLLHSAIFTALEAMTINGMDVVKLISEQLGIEHMKRAERLAYAHCQMLATSQLATSARPYGKTLQSHLGTLLFPLARNAPYIHLDSERRERISRSFGSKQQTMRALRIWCKLYGMVPSIRAYYKLGIGSPAYYMEAQRQAMPATMEQATQVREVELDMGKAYQEAFGTPA